MKLVAFVLFLYLEGFSQAQTTTNSEATTISPKCPAPKQLIYDNNGFVVQLNQNVVYIYVLSYNLYLVLNIDLDIFVLVDGTNETSFGCAANSGLAGMSNPKTNLMYVTTQHLKQFDISKVLQGNFTIVPSLIDYALLYTDKVLGSDIDTTQHGYANISTILQDYATTTDFTKWVSYETGNDGNTSFWGTEIKTAMVLYNLFQCNAEYTVEWGVVMFYVAASEQYKKEEECQTAYIDVMMRVIRDHNAAFDSTLMNKLYNIVSTQKNMTKEEAIQNYEALLENE